MTLFQFARIMLGVFTFLSICVCCVCPMAFGWDSDSVTTLWMLSGALAICSGQFWLRMLDADDPDDLIVGYISQAAHVLCAEANAYRKMTPRDQTIFLVRKARREMSMENPGAHCTLPYWMLENAEFAIRYPNLRHQSRDTAPRVFAALASTICA